jgi:uncharacterized membrane protein
MAPIHLPAFPQKSAQCPLLDFVPQKIGLRSAAAIMSAPESFGSRPKQPLPSVQLFELTIRSATLAMVASFALVLLQTILGKPLPGPVGWPETLLILFTTTSTLLSLSRPLPGAKVLLAAGVIALVGGGVHALGTKTAFPFGPFSYTSDVGPKWFGVIPWWLPAIWIIFVLSARGVARLILRPWRKTKMYGFWVIGLATAFVPVLNLAGEIFATRIATYWVWLPTKFPFTWHNMPWTNSLGWALTTLLLLAFCTPVLINKYPRSRRHRIDYQPLLVWNGLILWFGLSAALNGIWSGAILCAVASVFPTVFAIRGARW